MCLTIPKKVISVKKGNIIVENSDGTRQNMKSIVKLDVGDYCLSQQGVIIDKINKETAEEIIKIMERGTI